MLTGWFCLGYQEKVNNCTRSLLKLSCERFAKSRDGYHHTSVYTFKQIVVTGLWMTVIINLQARFTFLIHELYKLKVMIVTGLRHVVFDQGILDDAWCMLLVSDLKWTTREDNLLIYLFTHFWYLYGVAHSLTGGLPLCPDVTHNAPRGTPDSILTAECRHQKTTSNLLRIHLKGKLRFGNGSPQEGAMYINLFSGHSGKIFGDILIW